MTTTIAVCTTRAGQTSTSWAVSVAWTLAATRTVALVDCDMEGGTIADLLYLPVGDRSIANCLGERQATPPELDAQSIPVPGRPRLRVVPGLRGTFGFDIVECLRRVGGAMRGLDYGTVVADLGHPLSHPGLRSPRAAADAICSTFARVFVVLRDEPALVSRSLDVLRGARMRRGEVVICEQRGRALQRLLAESLRRELPDLSLRRGWSWDERRAARAADSGRPVVMAGIDRDLSL
ncbi:MAG TPA: hypothetical protein VF155_08075 [Candidatus Dormibacteraeota bacterium]